MMSPAQRTFYFTLWNRVCVEQGWYHLPTAEKDCKRRALHLQAGCPASSKAFTNQHFDRFKHACLSLVAGKNDPHTSDEVGQRRRLVWRIKDDAKKAGLDAAYILGIARDLTGLGNWLDLDLDSLTTLMKTIHNRAGRKLGHDPRNVRHTAPRHHYTMAAIPRMFAPGRAGGPPADTRHPAGCNDNEPF